LEKRKRVQYDELYSFYGGVNETASFLFEKLSVGYRKEGL
jgi:hypothetical protein